MTDTKKKDIVNPIAAAVTGAAVGAGVAIAGAIALKDEKNRKKIKGVLSDLKNKGEEIRDEMNKEAGDKVEEIKDKANDLKENADDKEPKKLSS